MTDKELRHLSRGELLQMMIAQSRELEELRTRLERAETALRRREIAMDRAGSIAEAALQLNGVFDAAEAACQQYAENIRDLSGRQQEVCQRLEQESQARAAALLADAQSRSDELERQTQERCQRLEQETQERCRQLDRQTQEKAQAAWNGLSAKLEAYCTQHQELLHLMNTVLSGSRDRAHE